MSNYEIAPGIDGYRAAQEDSRRNSLVGIQGLHGIMGIQNMMQEQQLLPLKLQQLQMSLKQAQMMNDWRQQFLNGGGNGENAAPALAQGASLGDVGPTNTNAQRMDSMSPQWNIPPHLRFPLASGDPGAEKIAAAEMKFYEPRNASPGDVVLSGNRQIFAAPTKEGLLTEYGPNGPSQRLIPGAAENASRLAASNKGGELFGALPYTTETVTPAGGPPTLMTGTQKIQSVTGALPQAPWAPQGGMPNLPPPTNLPQRGNVSVAPSVSLQELQRISDPAERSRAIGAYGPQGGGNPAVPARAVIGGGMPLQDPTVEAAKKAEAQKVGEWFGEQFTNIQKAGTAAPGKIAKLDRVEQLLNGIDTGKLTPLSSNFVQTANSLGFKIDPKWNSVQAAEALANEMALELRNPAGGAGMPGAMSDADREYLRGMVPGVEKTPEGRAMIMNTAKTIAKRDQEVAQLARDYRKKNGGIDEGFGDELARFSNSNPMFRSPQADGGNALSSAEAAELANLRKRFKR